MTKKINKKFLVYILVFVSLVLVSAYVIEYMFGHQPCKLCLYERIPYFLSILLISKILFIKGSEKIILLILSLVFIISAILAFYHFGIERGFFEESLACTVNNFSENLTKEMLLEQLKDSGVSCKDVSFTVFGLSLAAINIIFSIVLSAIFRKAYFRYGKN